jgi:hypothetical protein
MTRPVILIRRFTQIPETWQDGDVKLEQIWPYIGNTERVGWPQLEGLHRAVVLADAGAGKTFELMAQARNMTGRGKFAFFVRIEDIDADFGAAFEVGDAAAFDRWLDGVEEAWFFLDSVDEVRLETPRAFEMALRAFALRIHDARQRAHVIVSSRPYAWNSKLDNALIQELLPYEPEVDVAEPDDEGDITAPGPASGEPHLSPLKLFRLAPLDRDDIALFAGRRGVIDTSVFIDALERAALFDLAQLPFDLEDLIGIWKDTGSLASRLRVLELGLERRLSPKPGLVGALPLGRALSGARRLALAATLLNEANIRLPGGAGGGLEAATVLADWSEADVRTLLEQGVFSDAIYAMVRFRHRESRELLAAQQLAEILRKPDRRVEVEEVLFQTVYGKTIVPPRARPLLAWMILYDEPIRTRALALAPELATEGGDAARLPLEVRSGILRDIVSGIADNQDRGGDNSQIARIAQEDLSDLARDLTQAHGDNDDVIFFLGRLVWQGKMRAAAEALAPIALDAGRGKYARIVSVRAIATVLGAQACRTLWAALNAADAVLPRHLLAELVTDAPPDEASVDLLLASIAKLESYERFQATGLTQAIHNFIDRLPMMNDKAPKQPLARLVKGLAGFLAREPHVERRECRVSEAFKWLMGTASHAVERLVVGRSGACFEAEALAILSQAPALRDWGESEDRDHKSKLAEVIPRWPPFNDAFFWYSVALARAATEAKGGTLVDVWSVEWMGHYWSFDAASFPRVADWIGSRLLADDRAVALSLAFKLYVQTGRSRDRRRALWRAVNGDTELEAQLARLMRPPASPERRRQRARTRKWTQRSRQQQEGRKQNRASWVARIKADPALVGAPIGPGPGEMTWDQVHVLQSLPSSGSYLGRGAATAWPGLIPEFGDAVTEAFRAAALAHWRRYQPSLRSEGGHDNTIPYALSFGMVGLEFEAGSDGQGLAMLSEADTRLAMRYAFRELNGFPTWFEPLYRAHPTVALAMVWGEARWELANGGSGAPMHYILSGIVYSAPWLHADLAPRVHDWLLEHGVSNQEALRQGHTILVSGTLPSDAIAALARARIASAETPIDQLPVWFAMWVDSDPDAAIPILAAKLAEMPLPDDARFAERFAVTLVGSRRNGAGPSLGGWRTPAHLKALYILMHRHIRVAEDINRANGGVYSPALRDDAQDARGALFSQLAQIPGEQTYREILELADQHPEPDYRAYMRRSAHDRAVADGDRLLSLEEISDLIA